MLQLVMDKDKLTFWLSVQTSAKLKNNGSSQATFLHQRLVGMEPTKYFFVSRGIYNGGAKSCLGQNNLRNDALTCYTLYEPTSLLDELFQIDPWGQ